MLNFGIGALQQRKADQAIAILQSKLVVQTKVLRDGKWQFIPSALLVPDDVIELSVGDLVPADACIIKAQNFSANEAALTGESMPKNKTQNDKVLAGSVSVGVNPSQLQKFSPPSI